MTCAGCKAKGWDKETYASEPRCAFPNGGTFTSNNWNCVTANLIRQLCGDYGDEREYLDRRQWNSKFDNGDQAYVTIELPEIEEFLDRENYGGWTTALWVTWYKRRGCTDNMVLLSDEAPPRHPTEAECLLIIKEICDRYPEAREAMEGYEGRTSATDTRTTTPS